MSVESIEKFREEFKKSYDLPQEIEALQSSIELYMDCEETYQTAITLFRILIDRIDKALSKYYELDDQLRSDC